MKSYAVNIVLTRHDSKGPSGVVSVSIRSNSVTGITAACEVEQPKREQHLYCDQQEGWPSICDQHTTLTLSLTACQPLLRGPYKLGWALGSNFKHSVMQ